MVIANALIKCIILMLTLSGRLGSFFLKKYINKCINKPGYVDIDSKHTAKIGHKKNGLRMTKPVFLK
jgi:hypothetical protein